MTTRLLLARHGETNWNLNGRWQGQSDVPLNQTGMKQAEELGLSLKGKEIGAIYSSDLKRAVSTAEIVSGHLGIGMVATEERLRERNFGAFEGLTTSQIAESLGVPVDAEFMLDMDRYSNVEPWNDFVGRAFSAINEIALQEMGKIVLVVAHGGVMRGLYQKLMDGHKPRTFFNNGEILTLEKGNGSWVLR